MRIIEENIRWYEDNATGWYDNLVKIELKKIKDLYYAYEDSTDEMFVNEIIESFCKIIENQRERICELEANEKVIEANFPKEKDSLYFQNYLAPREAKTERFENDRQLQSAFSQYCLSEGKSSYTANDYCSRIKNLWRGFFEEYNLGQIPNAKINEEAISPDTPLLNAFYHTQELNRYINEKIANSEGNRNLANTRAALNKLEEFKNR